MTQEPIELDFKSLDDLALGVALNRVSSYSLPEISLNRLGPIIEGLSVSENWQSPLWERPSLKIGRFSGLVNDTINGKTRTQMSGAPLGWICADQIFNNGGWTGFQIRISAAMNAGGFDTRTKNGVVAMLGEFRSNIAEHAGSFAGSVVAFCMDDSIFEVVVADRGRGVLQSLRDNPKFADLDDAGQALRLAVSEGVSRHADSCRGHGFTPLFKGLANRFSHIRLRSGNHALEVFQTSEEKPMERISQKAENPGLFVYARFDRSKPIA